MRHLPSRSHGEGQDTSWPGQYLTPSMPPQQPSTRHSRCPLPEGSGLCHALGTPGTHLSTAGVTPLCTHSSFMLTTPFPDSWYGPGVHQPQAPLQHRLLGT